MRKNTQLEGRSETAAKGLAWVLNSYTAGLGHSHLVMPSSGRWKVLPTLLWGRKERDEISRGERRRTEGDGGLTDGVAWECGREWLTLVGIFMLAHQRCGAERHTSRGTLPLIGWQCTTTQMILEDGAQTLTEVDTKSNRLLKC
jgi:hypothetical protein